MNDAKTTSAIECSSMEEVRESVDSIDLQLVELLVQRFSYMDAAARIKENRESVRDERRKAEVLENVRRTAQQRGIPEGLTDELWEKLVEASILYEFDKWDKHRA